MIVKEVEQEAVLLAGPFILKEHDSFVAVRSEWVRVNHSFVEMKVVYGPREAPREKKRSAEASASSVKATEEPTIERAKKTEAVGAQTVKISSTKIMKGAAEKPPRASVTKPAAGKLKEPKRKGIYPYGYSFHIAKEDLGSNAFMQELRSTESSVPWRSRSCERFHLYLDQFGSFRAEPDTVGTILMAVQKGARAPLRVVNLLDEESDEETPLVPAKVSPEKEAVCLPQIMDEGTLSPEKMMANKKRRKIVERRFL